MQGRSSPRRVGEEVEGAQCWAHGVGHRVVEVRVSPPEPDAAISGRSGNYAHASRGCKPSQGCVLCRPRTCPVRGLPASLPCSVFAGESRPYFPERPLDSLAMTGGRESGGIAYWLRQRKASYIALRVGKLLRRYGLRAAKAKQRTSRFVELLARYECAPTLATPGAIVAKHPAFMRELRDAGVELAIHGFDHVDFRSLSRDEARSQFIRATSAYGDAGIPFKGFRCPYLSFSHD